MSTAQTVPATAHCDARLSALCTGARRDDSSATQVLREVVAGLSARDIRFVVARARTVVVELIDRFDLTDVLGPDNRFPTVRAAVLAVAGVDVTGDT